MARLDDRRKAIILRKKGETYSEIRKALAVPKSTLSDWLNNYPLTEIQIARLQQKLKRKRYLAIEKTRLTKLKKRESRLDRTYKKQRKRLLPLSIRELYLCGLFLYWGEGVKGLRSGVSLSNTDPKVVKFYYRWLTQVLKVPREKVRVAVHLYKDMNVKKALNFWSTELGLPLKQFIKPYIKVTKKSEIDHKGFGHGTCGIYVYDQYLKEKVMLGIESIADWYCQKK
jgi:hypothetical protein